MINKYGFFNITPKLTDYNRYYLYNFHATPHLKRDSDKLNKVYDGSNGYNGQYGKNGEFFIKNITDTNGKILNTNRNIYEIKDFDTIIDFKNNPPSQPSINCPWKPNKDGTKLITNEDVLHYQNDYGWIKWLIRNIFKDKYTLNGEYTSNKGDDTKRITIKDNKISIRVKNGYPSTSSTNGKTGFNTKNTKISIHNGTLTINPQKKKESHEIINDLINRTKNNNIKWRNEPISIKGSKYLTNIDFGSGVKILLSLFTQKFNSNKNYINIHVEKNNNLYFYKTISSYSIDNLVKLVEKETK